jgi:hypothetical protein
MPRASPAGIRVDPNLRALAIYPTADTRRQLKNLKTVGIRLSREQALHLARVLLAVTQEWPEIDITGYRLDARKSDGTYHVTVTGLVEE